MNKRRQRTQALMQATTRRRIAEQADNAIEEQQHRFDRLVRSGVIVALIEVENPKTTLVNIMFEAQRQKNRLLISEAGGKGKAGCGCL